VVVFAVSKNYVLDLRHHSRHFCRICRLHRAFYFLNIFTLILLWHFRVKVFACAVFVSCRQTGCCCVHDACACACRLLIDARIGSDDVADDYASIVMTTAVGVASFVFGSLVGALAGGLICRRRSARYFVSRTTKTNLYKTSASSTRALRMPLPSSDSSPDADDVFLSISPPHQLTVSDASFRRQLMLKSTESFRSMRTKLDSDDT